MMAEVHVKDKMFVVECGEGMQKIRWLGDVGIFRYENFYSSINGNPKGMRFESGEVLKMSEKICENLKDESHVWVVLKEDLEALGIDSMKNSFAAPKILTQENEVLSKNSEFRIRPQTSMTRFKKK